MNSQKNRTQSVKKSYHTPALVLYGALQELTKGGTGALEGMGQGKDMRP